MTSDASRAIFDQLREESQPGVRCVIENHDAWLHSSAVMLEVTAAVRERLAREPRPADLAARIDRQRKALAPLVVKVPARVHKAG